MSIELIERDFIERVSEQIRLREEGVDKYRVFTPFCSDDGDHLVIVLKRELNKWVLTDNGHTYMHLSYDLDEESLTTGTRQQIISRTLNSFSVNDVNGELRLEIENNQFGNALYDFVQALLRINDVTYLSRERVKSTFMEDFRVFIESRVPESRRRFDWHHPQFDPEGSYAVDCRINGMKRPLMVFALANDSRTRDATISILQLERWGVEFRSLSIFENQEEISRKVLARFSDVCDKQYSSLTTNKDRIGRLLSEVMEAG
jgi:hypothetical protein